MKRDQFEGRERLVMIHRDEGIVFSMIGCAKKKIG